jgi:hypothetical protein
MRRKLVFGFTSLYIRAIAILGIISKTKNIYITKESSHEKLVGIIIEPRLVNLNLTY